jgi:hypothetical protein
MWPGVNDPAPWLVFAGASIALGFPVAWAVRRLATRLPEDWPSGVLVGIIVGTAAAPATQSPNAEVQRPAERVRCKRWLG